MSRVYDELKKAQQRRASSDDRRRSARLVMDVPLFVYGRASDNKPFHEDARTVQISANGGLLRMACSVRVGQELLLTNPQTHQQQRCQVVSVGPPEASGARVSVAFSAPATGFWAVAFPRI